MVELSLLKLTANIILCKPKKISRPWPDHWFDESKASMTFSENGNANCQNHNRLLNIRWKNSQLSVCLVFAKFHPRWNHCWFVNCTIQKMYKRGTAGLKTCTEILHRKETRERKYFHIDVGRTADPEMSISWGVCAHTWRGCDLVLQGVTHCSIKHSLTRRWTL